MIFSTKLLETLFIFKNISKNIKCWTSNKTSKNTIYVSIYFNIYKILFFFKNSLQQYYLSLIDVCGIDVTSFNLKYFFKQSLLFKFLIIFNLNNYKTFNKILLLSFLNKNYLYSIDGLFFNSNWLERELIEFFNINVLNKNDTRNLLLDYNFIGAPLLKSFPTEGYVELFFNFNTFNLDYVSNEFIEL